MKFLPLLLLSMTIMVSCSDDKPQPKGKAVKTQTTDQSTDNAVTEEPQTYTYYVGTVGLYEKEVVVELSHKEDQIIGGYWYLDHQKRLELSGTSKPKSGDWHLTESWKGKTTGRFDLLDTGDSLIGKWYAPGKKEGEPVKLRKIITDAENPVAINFETYTFDHTIEVYDIEESEMVDVTDEFNCVRLEDYLLFSYGVTGANAHMGFISGLAEMQSDKKALFKGEMECELTILFEGKNKITISEESCSYYRGMRAYFDGTLTKTQ